jgi:hypothetical protein
MRNDGGGMTQTSPEPDGTRPRRRLRRASIWSLITVLSLAAASLALAFYLIGRPVTAPEWVQQRIEQRLASELPEARISFGEMVIVVDEGWRPRVRLRDVVVRDRANAEIVSFNEIKASLSMRALLDGAIQPHSLYVSGVFASLRRDVDGRVSLSAGSGGAAPTREAATLAQLVGQIDEVFVLPSLSALSSVELRALTLRFDDARAQRAWTADGGRLRLARSGDDLSLSADLALLGGGTRVAVLEASYDSRIGEPAAEFGISFEGVSARDVASQGPAFAWLDIMRAPISGSVRGGITEDERLKPLNATLQVGNGVVQPNPQTRPIPFDTLRSYFSFDPETQVLTFDDLSLRSKWLSGQVTGAAHFDGITAGRLEAMVGQFRLQDFSANPDDLFDDPVEIAAAEVDLRLQLDPFHLQIGRLQITDSGSTLQAEGDLRADSEGWKLGVDGQMDALTPERLLAFWPEGVKPKTRKWVSENLYDGTLSNIDVALRMAPDAPPQNYLAFDFDGAEVRFMRTLPNVTEGRGHASLIDNRFVVAVDQGQIVAPEGGPIAVGGSSFIMPDVRVKDGPPGIVRLRTRSSLTAALSLLDQPPMRVMQKTGLPVTLAEGEAVLEGTLAFPLKKGGKPEDVRFDIAGTLRDLDTERLVKNRRLQSEALTLTASNDRIAIGGDGTLDGIAINANWSQKIGPGSDRSQLEGRIALTKETLETFDIALPPGTLSGAGSGDISVDLQKGQPPRFSLSSDLKGVRLAVPQLSWVKPAGATGRLDLVGTLGAVPQVNSIRIDGAGLRAVGNIRLSPDGALDRVRFDRVAVGNWLDVPVDMIGRGKGEPLQISVRGGKIDLRRAAFGKGPPNARPGPPLLLNLDRLQITDSIALTEMQGRFQTFGGLDGSFKARLNGETPVQGRVLPRNGRSAIRLVSEDAGGVMRSANLIRQVRGGDFSLTLLPVGTGGAFDGQLNIGDVRIKDAPGIAALLNAISVVGLINELNGDGIYFDDVSAAFRLTPKRLVLTEASATGASMGLSMDGIYALDTGQIDMQGVVSPVYMLNGIGSLLTRKGEGLIGFNYRLTGPAKAPQVSVNPLSALTPGGLRNIFRAPRTEAPKVEGEVAAPRPAQNKSVVRDYSGR